MLVLGIETSCDETAAAVVKDGKTILSSVVASSLKLHQPYGGIIPEIASRQQIELILPVVEQAIKKAKINLKDIDLISVASCPGLKGSLLVGTTFARVMSLALKIPLVEVDHTHAHLFANFLSPKKPSFPFVGLVVSGGHTSLYVVKSAADFKLLGKTSDDAAGEAFDKVAKILNLGYPGGPIIDNLAKKGNPRKIKFSCAAGNNSFNFSFSGIKTAVLYFVRDKWNKNRVSVADIASSFQESVVNVLSTKTIAACQKNRIRELSVGGGVSANSGLRETLSKRAREQRINVYFPPKELCLDNAAMVAALGQMTTELTERK